LINQPIRHRQARYNRKHPIINSPIAFLFEKSLNVASLSCTLNEAIIIVIHEICYLLMQIIQENRTNQQDMSYMDLYQRSEHIQIKQHNRLNLI
jgi:hypothetical protein